MPNNKADGANISLKIITAKRVAGIRKSSEIQSHDFASKMPLQFIICHHNKNAPAQRASMLQ